MHTEEIPFTSELPPPQGVFRREREEFHSGNVVPIARAEQSGLNNADNMSGSFVSRFLSSIPVSSRPNFWINPRSSLSTTAQISSTSQGRAMPPGLEQVQAIFFLVCMRTFNLDDIFLDFAEGFFTHFGGVYDDRIYATHYGKPKKGESSCVTVCDG